MVVNIIIIYKIAESGYLLVAVYCKVGSISWSVMLLLIIIAERVLLFICSAVILIIWMISVIQTHDQTSVTKGVPL